MMLNNNRIGKKNTTIIGIIIFLATLISGLMIIGDIGPASIETANFKALKRQNQWFANFATEDFKPFSAETLNKYWNGVEDSNRRVIYANPPLTRTLMSAFQPIGKIFAGNWESMRAFPVFCFSALTALLFFWLAGYTGITGALAASLIFAFIPRALANGIQADHYSFLALIWFLAGAVFIRDKDCKCNLVMFGILAGVGMSISVTFTLFFLTAVVWSLFSGNLVRKLPVLIAGVVGAVILPIILNPVWWHNPIGGYFGYIGRNIGGYIGYDVPVKYFGELYHSGLPWHYVIIMLLLTFPVVSLTFILAGKLVSATPGNYKSPAGFALTTSTLFIITGLFARFPASEGMSWFLPVYAADAIMGAYGFVWLLSRLAPRFQNFVKPISALGLAAFAIPPLVLMISLFPAISSHYNPLIGFLKGANRAGMELTFDGSILNRENVENFNSIVFDKANLKPDDKETMIYVKDVGVDLAFLRKRGEIPGRIMINDNLYSYCATLDRPGDFTREDELLNFYGAPFWSISKGGVKLFNLYEKENEFDRIYDLLLKKYSANASTIDDAYYVGVLYEAAHMHDRAKGTLKYCLTKDSTHAGANFVLGYIDYYTASEDSSVMYLEKAVSRKPDNTEYLYYLGMACNKIKRLDKALQAFETAHRIKPFDKEINTELGTVCLENGDYERARNILEMSIETDTLNLKSMFLIASSYEMEKNYEMSENSYGRIEAINPKHPIYLRTKAEMYEKWGKWDKAAQTYEKILEIRSNYPMIQTRLADLYDQKLDNPEKALEMYEKLVAFHPDELKNKRIELTIKKLRKKLGQTE